MKQKRYRVGGTVTSTNKRSQGFNVLVWANSKTAAENAGKTKVKKSHPDGFITIGVVTEDE